MRKLILLILFLLPFFVFSQYQRKWASYAGPSNSDVTCMDVDSEGNIIVAGNIIIVNSTSDNHTYYQSFETIIDGYDYNNFYQHYPSEALNYICKISPDGNLIWFRYLPGAINNLQINGSNDIFLVSNISSDKNFATSNSYMPERDSASMSMLWKLNKNGIVNWATNLPLTTSSINSALCIEGNEIVVSGSTWNRDQVGTPGTFLPNYTSHFNETLQQFSPNNAVINFSSDGTLNWGTYFGIGTSPIITKKANKVVVLSTIELLDGLQSIENFATTGPLSPLNGSDFFNLLAELDIEHGQRVWASQFSLDVSNEIQNLFIKADEDGNFLIIGDIIAASDTFTMGNVFRSGLVQGVQDNFICKLGRNLEKKWCTLFGSENNDYFDVPLKTALISNKIIVGSTTNGNHYIATDSAFKNNLNGETDGYIQVFDTTGNITYGTYLGGNNIEDLTGATASGDTAFIW